MSRQYLQGKYVPKNPKKYVGDVSKIFARSSWEFKAMIRFDTDPAILFWSSEQTIIPYISPVDNLQHRYFVDFSIQYKTADGKIKKALIEVKPNTQINEPKKPKKVSERFINEVKTYSVNQAKWTAAKAWCERHGYDWHVWDEYTLGIKKRKVA